jgi:hypothetical protein
MSQVVSLSTMTDADRRFAEQVDRELLLKDYDLSTSE